MTEKPITVSADELHRAIAVWLKVAPRGIWARYARQSLLSFLKVGERPLRDEAEEIAAHLAGKLVQAGWTVTRPAAEHPSGSAGR